MSRQRSRGRGGVVDVSHRRRAIITITIIGAVIAAVLGVIELVRSPTSPSKRVDYSEQTVLPLSGLHDPTSVAVDDKGDIYVADTGNRRVLKLARGSTGQTQLPFTGLQNLTALAVDDKGDVFAAYSTDGFPAVGKVVKLALASSSQSVVPFTGLVDPRALAVDTVGDIFVADGTKQQVVELPAGSGRQTVLPFHGLGSPQGLAVDTGGDIYVTGTQMYGDRGMKRKP